MTEERRRTSRNRGANYLPAVAKRWTELARELAPEPPLHGKVLPPTAMEAQATPARSRATQERRAVAAVALALPFILVAQSSVFFALRAAGRSDAPPAEWVSAVAVPLGLLLGWTTRLGRRLAQRLPARLDDAWQRHRSLALVIAAFGLLAIVQTARVSAFMVDVTLRRDAAFPAEGPPHQCVTAYVQAAELARARDPNLYAASHYEAFQRREALALLPPEAYSLPAVPDAMHAHSVHLESEDERDLFGLLRCMCGCPRGPENLLSTCACGAAEAAREKIRGELAKGRSHDQILVAYQAANGPSALASPGPSDPSTTIEHMQDHLFDPYEYPPPFLVLPRFALALTNDFRVLRAAWFFLQTLAIGALTFAVARWIGGREGLLAGLLLPALWSSRPFLENLETGQLHFLTLALAIGGMVAIDRQRDTLGGAVLGAASVMKVTPGLLLLFLLARGRTRAVAITLGWVGAYAVLGLVVLGGQPFVAFLHYQLPRLTSGEAFAFFLGRPGMLVGNFGVYALPLKLRGLGLPGITLGTASTVAWAYGLLLLPIAVLAARRSHGGRLDLAQRWLAVLNLAALRSPMAPYGYVTSGTVWLLTLLAPNARSTRALAYLVVAWLGLAVGLFVVDGGAHALPDLTAGQLLLLTVNLWVALRRTPRGPECPQLVGEGSLERSDRLESGGVQASPRSRVADVVSPSVDAG